MDSAAKPLSAVSRWAYAAPGFALAIVGIPVYVYLPKFYTDVIGVSVATVGLLLFSVRIFDALTDPLIGRLSDRYEGSLGRRRPWLLYGSAPLALALYLIFTPPDLTGVGATLWLAVSVFALFLFWTAVTVPYEALGPELSEDYDERTSLLGLRDGMLILGTLVAAASPALVSGVFGLGTDGPDQRAVFRIIALVYAPLLVLVCILCVAYVPERLRARGAQSAAPFEFRSMLGNRPFGVLLASYTIAAFGSNLPATLILYYVQYVLKAENAEFFLLLYFVTGVVCLPGWVWLARRWEKKNAWISAMAINTGAFAGVYLLGAGDVAAYAPLVFLSGVGFGATLAIPSSMQADVIDYDELRTGQRREGQYIGVWSVARKLAAALGVGLALSILGSAGYEPNAEQSPQVIHTLRILYAGVPCLCSVLGILIALAYPITRERHIQNLEQIRSRTHGLE